MQKRGQYILESERVMTKGTFAKKKKHSERDSRKTEKRPLLSSVSYAVFNMISTVSRPENFFGGKVSILVIDSSILIDSNRQWYVLVLCLKSKQVCPPCNLQAECSHCS